MNYSIYKPKNIQDIKNVYTDTFSDSEGKLEGKLIGELALNMLTGTNKDELFCFVATDNKKVIGAVIFTKITLDADISAFILSPMAISTAYQGKGLGQELITFAIEVLKTNEVELIFTYGDPNYYNKTGFQQISEEQIKAPQPLSFPHGWLCQSLTSIAIPTIKGDSRCVAALNKLEYW